MSNYLISNNNEGYWRYALFAAPLAAVGIPIYIYAPKYLADSYGFSLTSLGIIFLCLRLVDVVQDPLLGRLAQLVGKYRQTSILFFVCSLIISLWLFFSVEPIFEPVAYVCLCLFVMFTAFSYLNICFYAQGVNFVESSDKRSHSKLSVWRETGALVGIVLACLLPSILSKFDLNPMKGFAFSVIILLLISYFVMRGSWNYKSKFQSKNKAMSLLKDKTTRSFLILSFLNTSPLAVTSTLFLFYVESRLQATDLAGLFLITFFISAAISIPFWGKLTSKYELKFILSIGMSLAIITFLFTCLIGSGDIVAFFIICMFSGASLGADMSILPAMYAKHISNSDFDSSVAFGIWNFFNKSTFALSVGIILPALAATGFAIGRIEPNTYLMNLTIFYSIIPCLLKLLALLTLNFGPFERKLN